MILFKSKFIDVVLHQQEKVISGIWKNTNAIDFNEANFKNNMLNWFEEVKKIKNVNVLADARQFHFTIPILFQL